MRNVFIVFLMLWTIPVFAEEEPIQPGDVVRISVYNNPDLTIETDVANNGNINFPLIGEVNISGLTAIHASQKIESKLIMGNYLKKPQVNVVVLESKTRRISVLGNVHAPGRYQIDIGNKTVVDFISLAGGLAPNASSKVIIVKFSKSTPQKLEIDLDKLFKQGDLMILNSEELKVKSGDIIYVPQAPVFYIFGEVNRPGSYVLKDGMTVAQSISLGGGVSPRGSEGSLVLKRKNEAGVLEELDVTENTEVKENDVIYVEESLF